MSINPKPYVPTGIAEVIFKNRYAIAPDESWDGLADRVSAHVANAEKGTIYNGTDKRSFWKDRFKQKINCNLFVPGGRILYGAGRSKGQLLNCFAIPTHDSREGWGKTTNDMIIISGTGGGVGLNATCIRPRGTPIGGVGGVATGAVSLFEIIDGVGEVIRMGGGRRCALMFDLRYDHADIEEFLYKKFSKINLTNSNIDEIVDIIHETMKFRDRKEVYKLVEDSMGDSTHGESKPVRDLISALVQQVKEQELKNANVSVLIDSKFIELVKTDGEISCMWRGEEIKRVKAKKIWDTIVYNAWLTAEPGILNEELANQMNNIWYHKRLITTNPCGEIWLEEYGCCDLGHINVSEHYDESTNDIDWDMLADTTCVGIRFLDNVLDVNIYPLKEIEENCISVRRVGLGITGLADLFLKMGIRYGSKKSLDIIDNLMDFIKRRAYETSCFLSVEKGPFPVLDRDKFLQSGFMKTMPKNIKKMVKEHGIRNCAVLTIAPVGTGSMVAASSSALEPVFAAAYNRRWRAMDEAGNETMRSEVIVHPLFKKMVMEGKDVSHFVPAYEVTPREHLEVQYTCQKHIDNAVSKTINLPTSITVEELSDLLLEYAGKLKGTTIYREGSRGSAPLEALSVQDAKRIVLEQDTVSAVEVNDCPTGICEMKVKL